jgi:hypothetical protein
LEQLFLLKLLENLIATAVKYREDDLDSLRSILWPSDFGPPRPRGLISFAKGG